MMMPQGKQEYEEVEDEDETMEVRKVPKVAGLTILSPLLPQASPLDPPPKSHHLAHTHTSAWGFTATSSLSVS